jgi:prepilin-type N-terminal cleavage/methylation domain-containing protein
VRSPPDPFPREIDPDGSYVKKETGMRKLLVELRKRRGNQNGFTLIEMLVVISILGILAAIVTMSMVGVTSLAHQRALDSERQTIQVALDTMASENNVPADEVCPSPNPAPTDNMAAFPTSDPSQGTPPSGHAEPLYPRYIRSNQTTQQSYSCDSNGNVVGTGK